MKLFTIDARCSRCGKKTDCTARVEILTTLSALTNKMNTDPAFTGSPGEGIIILSCDDFGPASLVAAAPASTQTGTAPA